MPGSFPPLPHPVHAPAEQHPTAPRSREDAVVALRTDRAEPSRAPSRSLPVEGFVADLMEFSEATGVSITNEPPAAEIPIPAGLFVRRRPRSDRRHGLGHPTRSNCDIQALAAAARPDLTSWLVQPTIRPSPDRTDTRMGENELPRPDDEGRRARGRRDGRGSGGGRRREGRDDARRPSGPELLRDGTTREVLRRIWEGDPLKLGDLCEERLDERALLIDVTRAQSRAMALVAHAASRFDGQKPFAPWLRERVDAALDDLLDEDGEDERAGVPPSEPWDPRFAFLSEVLGIEPGLARRACVLFNALPHPERRAFWAVVIEGKSIARHVAEGHGPPDLARARVEHALLTVSTLGEHDMPCPDGRDRGEPEEGSDER